MNLRHDTREVEDLSRQVSHVAVDENKKWLDDACVGSEAGREGGEDAVDGPHQDAAQSNHQEGNDSQETIHHSHLTNRKFFKKVV